MKIFAANWKLNKNPKETREFFSEFTAHLSKGSFNSKNKIVIFPSAFCLESAFQATVGASEVLQLGAQNTYVEVKGAFTGENSALVAKDIGAKWILIGHSERRALFNEKDALLAKKLKLTQDIDLTPMFCIGETLEEREFGKTNEVLSKQLEQGLQTVDKQKPIAIAYEPVWAIGTGKVASIEQVKETHAFIRQKLNQMGLQSATPILYGGSVKAETSKEMIQISNVDGFLVGGASLEAHSFWQICQS